VLLVVSNTWWLSVFHSFYGQQSQSPGSCFFLVVAWRMKAYIIAHVDGQLDDSRDQMVIHSRLVVLQCTCIVLDLSYETLHKTAGCHSFSLALMLRTNICAEGGRQYLSNRSGVTKPSVS